MNTYNQIIREICHEKGITIHSFAGEWAFLLQKENNVQYIYGYQFPLNLGVTQSICNDKAVSSEIMQKNKVACVPHHYFMSPEYIEYIPRGGNFEEMMLLLEKYKKVVIKNNEGTGGKDVYMASCKRELEKIVFELFAKNRGISISPYLEIENEYRAIVLDGKIELVFSKERPYVVGDGESTLKQLCAKSPDFMSEGGYIKQSLSRWNEVISRDEKVVLNWKHNLGQGAKPIVVDTMDFSTKAKNIVQEAIALFHLRFASIDLIISDNTWKILEINSGVMMENFAEQSSQNFQKAKEIYAKAIDKMFDL